MLILFLYQGLCKKEDSKNMFSLTDHPLSIFQYEEYFLGKIPNFSSDFRP